MPGTEGWQTSFQKNTNGWAGALVTPAALSELLLINDQMVAGTPEHVKDEAIGDAFASEAYVTRQRVVSPLGDMYARYEGLERVVAWCIGADSVAVVGGANDHTMALADTIEGLIAQYVLDKNEGNPWIYPSLKVVGFEMKVAENLVTITPSVIALKMDRTATPSFAAVTRPTEGLVINLNDLVVRINQDSAGALGSGDVVKVSDFTFSIQRQLEGDAVNNSDGTDDEPDATGMASMTLSMTHPNLEGDFDDIIAKSMTINAGNVPTFMKADLVFTGPSNGGDARILTIEMPKLKILNPEALGPGASQKVPVTLEFELYRAGSAPTGMTNLNPFTMTLTGSDNAASPL